MISVGAVAAKAVYLGTTAAKAVYVGATQVWSSFSPMGMDKSGTQGLGGSTWTKVTGWTARSGYPATVITDDELVANGAASVTIHAQITFASPGTSNNVKGCRVLVNGTVVATFSGQGSSPAQIQGGTHTMSLASGDLVEMEGYHSSSGGSNREIQSGASNTYLYFEVT